MKPTLFRGIVASCATAILTIVCAIPTTTQLFASGFPATDDGLDHQVRFTAFALALERGDWYPRWIAPLAVDYGSPIFTFYAPLSYYAGELFHLAGLSVDDSLRAVFAAGLLSSALTMFLLGRAAGGNMCGFVSGVLYAALPYQVHDVYTRGALAESLALALLPLPAFAILRYTQTGRRRWIALQALGIAAMILTHNISALLALVAFVVFAGAAVTQARSVSQGGQFTTMRTMGTLVLGVIFCAGLSAFFWVPALVDTGYIHADRMVVDVLDLHHYFNKAWPPWQTSWAFDYQFDRDTFPVQPGFVQLAIATLGIVALVVERFRKGSSLPLYWLLLLPISAVVLLWLQRSGSEMLWDHVPLARYVQFPYRLMSLFGLVTALLSGLFVATLPFAALRGAMAAVLVSCSLWASLATLHPTYTSGLPEQFGARGVLLTEAAMGELAGTTQSAEVPRWVTLDARGIIASVTQAQNAQDPMRTASQAPFSARVVGAGDTSITIATSASVPTTLILRRFYMPNWKAVAGGHDLVTHPVAPLGLLGVDIPVGQLQLAVYYSPSRIEWLSRLVSVASAMGLILWLAYPRVSFKVRLPLLVLGGVASVVLVFALVALSPRLLIRRGTELLPIEPREIAPGYQLAGVERTTIGKTDRWSLDYTLDIVAWQPGTDLLFAVDAFDNQGQKIAGVLQRPWNGPTSNWTGGELAPARLELSLPGGLPSQPMHTVITAYDARRPSEALSTLDLPPENVRSTPRTPYYPLANDFGATMAIRGYRLNIAERGNTAALRAGNTLELTLDLQSLKWMGEDQTVFVHLLDSGGKLRAQHDELAGGKARPTSRWVSGEPVRQVFPIVIPANASPGTYHLEVGFYQLATLKRLALLDPYGKATGDSLILTTVVDVR